MTSNAAVERVKPVGFSKALFLLIAIGLLAAFFYALLFPKGIIFNVQPAGASVYANGKLICANTPCNVTLQRVFPKHIVIDRAQHFPHHIKLSAFGNGWDDSLEGLITLKSMMNDGDKQRGLETCRAERARMPDQDNIDAQPCYRVPPIMPWRATRSGHCHLVFDVHNTGKTKNIRLNGCTGREFEAAATQAVAVWTYLPKIENGQAVARPDVKNKVTFRLTDEAGHIIPESAYYMENSEHEHTVSVHPSFRKVNRNRE